MSAPATVTRDGWHVSTTMGGMPGIQAVLNVSRSIGGKTLFGDLNGTVWPSSEAGHAAALAHGYTQWHVQEWCPRCRCLHWEQFNHVRVDRYDPATNAAGKPKGFVPFSNEKKTVRRRMGFVKGWLASTTWSTACFHNSQERIKKDTARFAVLESRFRTIMNCGNSACAELQEVWKEMEAIRNRNGGKLGGGK